MQCNPKMVNYTNHNIDDGIGFSYRFDVLHEARNKIYAKHEKNNNIKLVAVKITNNTGAKLNLASDVQFYSGVNPINPLEPETIIMEIKQGVPIYLLYLLLTPTNVYKTETTNGITEQKSIFPIGLILGPSISIGNMIAASQANNHCKQELIENSILKELEVGESTYGLVGFRGIGYDQITLKLKKNGL